MKVKILLFGVLAEEAGKDELEMENISVLRDLKKRIIEIYPSIGDYKFRISVNHIFAGEETILKNGDEVALLPPFAGG